MEDKGFSIIVLAGGQSSRMGRDKAELSWEHGDILNSLLARLLPLSDDVIVVSNVVRKIPQSVRQAADIIPGKGPLSGIHAGLVHACHDRVFVTACDVPFLMPSIILPIVQAVGTFDGSVAVNKGQLEPLFACYRKNCAIVIEQLLATGKHRMKDLLANINWMPVEQADQLAECCFMNVNTCDDYEKATAILVKDRQKNSDRMTDN
ncbi:MAG: molybdenum cofactor guanylyltransferase [Sporomusaceae bacterium]|nr:molybdenum cofactor guanylyltransferase [Sporomusaceae bacterium]